MTTRVPILLLALSGCSTSFDDDALAADLWADVQDYRSWWQMPGWTTEPTESGGHGGAFVVAWYDDAMIDWALEGEAPDGATSVKEGFDAADDAEPSGLTVMRKIDGYAPEGGDWFWAQYGSDGTVGAAGRVEMCECCPRGSAETSDYVFGSP